MSPRVSFRNPQQSLGGYWYSDEHGIVQGRYRADIIRNVRAHFEATGRVLNEDPFSLVMDCMCRTLPKGICTGGVGVDVTPIETVKTNTRRFFAMARMPYADVIRRLETCLSCPRHSMTACPTCTGISAWIETGFKGTRADLPVDKHCGVCLVDMVLVAAAATVEKEENTNVNIQWPEACWRR